MHDFEIFRHWCIIQPPTTITNMSRTRISYKGLRPKLIEQHNLPCGIDVIFPSDPKVESVVSEVIQNYSQSTTSHVVQGSLGMFFATRDDGSSFSAAVFQRSDAWIISNSRIESDNVYAVWGGHLYMSLTKSSYQTSGLPAKKSRFGEKYLVSLDLRSPDFHLGSKLHNRFLFGLQQLDKLDSNIRFSVTTNATDAEIVKSYLPNATQVALETTLSHRNLLVPMMEPPQEPELTEVVSGKPVKLSQRYRDHLFDNWALGVQEWLGLVAVGSGRVDTKDTVNSLFSLYEVEDGTPQDITCLRVTGMCPLLPQKLLELSQQLSQSQFFAFTVYGVQDTPYSWGNKEHQYDNGGENHYSVVTVGDETLTFETVCHSDMHV